MHRRAIHFPSYLFILTIVLAALAGVGPLAASGWPAFRGPYGAGVASDPLPAGEAALAFELAWKRPLGSGYSGVAVAEGVLVTAFQAGERDVVAAFDPATGEERWRYDLSPTYRGHDGSHDGPIATPAIAGGGVFMLGPTGRLVALDLETGAERWTVDLVEKFGSAPPFYGFASSPAVVGAELVVLQVPGREGEKGGVVAFDTTTGEVRWRSGEDDVMAQSPIVATVGGREQVLAIGSQNVTGLDPADGTVLWRFAHEGAPGPFGSWTSSPLPLGGDRVFLKHEDPSSAVVTVAAVASGEGKTAEAAWADSGEGAPAENDPARGDSAHGDDAGGEGAEGGDADGDDVEDGDAAEAAAAEDAPGGNVGDVARLATSRGMTRSYSPATVAGGTVYGFTARFLSAVDPASGDVLWRSRDVGDGFVIAVDDRLVALAKTGTLHLGPARPDGWSETARIELFDGELAWTPPSYAGGAIYARSLGELARVDLVRGRERTASAGPRELPAALTELAATLDGADDPGAAVEAFLAGRELPLIDGREVVFLWHGAAEDVAIAGDMIGMRREEPMRRLAGTDLWWWSTELDPRARLSYLFFVDYEPTVDPANPRTTRSTVLGSDMNWARAEGVEMSWFALPEWPGLAAVEVAETASGEAPESATGGGRVETFEVTVERTAPEGAPPLEPVAVPVHVWLPPGYDEGAERYPAVYVHHQQARDAGGWIETLDRVVGTTVRPLVAVFPEMPRARGMRGAFAGQIVPAVEARYRLRPERSARANVGMGWPAYQAAMQTFANPELFGALGVQSLYLLDANQQALEAAVGEQDADSLPLRVYLEWGRWDLVSPHERMDFRASSRWGWKLLTERGWEPEGGEVWDSTDFASWSHRTGVMLEALFPVEDGAPSSLARWQTGAP